MDQLESSSNFLVYLKTTWVWPGVVEVGQFLGTHLISGMIPAFLIAGAIAVLIDKERITRYLGPKASPLISFPVAALSGAILTVCSCGVIPIFTGILTRGAGVGPAFTFLFSAPAINLIAVTYTFTYMGTKVAIGRIMAVILCAIGLGIVMKTFFPDKSEITNCQVMAAEEDSERTDLQTGSFFFLLLFFMLTSTGFFDPIIQSIIPEIAASYLNIIGGKHFQRLGPKLLILFFEALVGMLMLKRWFHTGEVKLWLKKSWSLFCMIFPKVLLGIFLSGLLAAFFPLARYMKLFDENTFQANLIVSFFGAMMYFGTIVGVNVVATMTHFGMHLGPAMSFLLSGPSVSLPEILALIPIIGRKKAVVYFAFVIIATSLSGMIFGFFC